MYAKATFAPPPPATCSGGSHKNIFQKNIERNFGMKKRYNVVQAKSVPNQEKAIWLKHGAAFETDGKISIKLESLPIPNAEGDIWLKLFEADDKPSGSGAAANYMADNAGGGQAPWGDQGAKPLDAVPAAAGGLGDDEIPF